MDVREKLVELLTNSPQLDVLDWTIRLKMLQTTCSTTA